MELDIGNVRAADRAANPGFRVPDNSVFRLASERGPSGELSDGSDDLDGALSRARQGDEQGIASLFKALQPPLLRYLRHHAPAVAEDLASEVWMAAARHLTRFEGDATDLRAWLFTVGRRRVADHYRRCSRHPVMSAWDESMEHSDPTDVAAGVVDAISAQEAVDTLVRVLSADQAEVVLLRVVADLSVEQVATLMGRSSGSIRVLQHRALRRLATLGSTAVTL
jgi:RNA polymerase sigma-70 factor (ECF subfamily)